MASMLPERMSGGEILHAINRLRLTRLSDLIQVPELRLDPQTRGGASLQIVSKPWRTNQASARSLDDTNSFLNQEMLTASTPPLSCRPPRAASARERSTGDGRELQGSTAEM